MRTSVTGVRFIDRRQHGGRRGARTGSRRLLRLRPKRGAVVDVEVESANESLTAADILDASFIPHMTGGVQCFLTKLIGKPPRTMTVSSIMSLHPFFHAPKKRDYARSFGVQLRLSNRRRRRWTRQIPGFGKQYKQAIKDHSAPLLTFSPSGEKTQDDGAAGPMDPVNKDAWGCPLRGVMCT